MFDTIDTMTRISAGEAVGRNLRRIRESVGDTQTDCARKAHIYGLKWSHSHVSALERGGDTGRSSVTIEELVVLSSIYGVAISQWFEGEGDMVIANDHTVPLSDVRDLTGKKRISARRAWPREIDIANAKDYSADERIAKRLGLSQDQVTAIATDMWGHHATAEREKRLSEHRDKPPSEMRTLRAGMTKHLAHQIKLHIEEDAQ